MNRSFALVGVVVVVFAASGFLFGDDKDSKSDTKVGEAGSSSGQLFKTRFER